MDNRIIIDNPDGMPEHLVMQLIGTALVKCPDERFEGIARSEDGWCVHRDKVGKSKEDKFIVFLDK